MNSNQYHEGSHSGGSGGQNQNQNQNQDGGRQSAIRVGIRKATGTSHIDSFVIDINVPRSNRLARFFDEGADERGVQMVAKSGLHTTHYKFGTGDPEQFVRLVNRLLAHVDIRSLR